MKREKVKKFYEVKAEEQKKCTVFEDFAALFDIYSPGRKNPPVPQDPTMKKLASRTIRKTIPMPTLDFNYES